MYNPDVDYNQIFIYPLLIIQSSYFSAQNNLIEKNFFENFRDFEKFRCNTPKYNLGTKFDILYFEFHLLEDGKNKIICREDRIKSCKIDIDKTIYLTSFNFNNLYAGSNIEIITNNIYEMLLLKNFRVIFLFYISLNFFYFLINLICLILILILI